MEEKFSNIRLIVPQEQAEEIAEKIMGWENFEVGLISEPYDQKEEEFILFCLKIRRIILSWKKRGKGFWGGKNASKKKNHRRSVQGHPSLRKNRPAKRRRIPDNRKFSPGRN